MTEGRKTSEWALARTLGVVLVALAIAAVAVVAVWAKEALPQVVAAVLQALPLGLGLLGAGYAASRGLAKHGADKEGDR